MDQARLGVSRVDLKKLAHDACVLAMKTSHPASLEPTGQVQKEI
jgi:hypothetical protein